MQMYVVGGKILHLPLQKSPIICFHIFGLYTSLALPGCIRAGPRTCLQIILSYSFVGFFVHYSSFYFSHRYFK